MRILVLGDTHGKIDKALEVYKAEKEQTGGIDLVVHTGDLVPDAMSLSARIASRVIFVRGNNDPEELGPNYYILESEAGDILITHGHLDNVNFSQERLYYKMLDQGCVAAIYGHTHIPVSVELEDGTHIINPGSLTRPFDGSQGSYAIINTYEGGMNVSIKYYKNSKKPKVQGGHLRSLINYSDRF